MVVRLLPRSEIDKKRAEEKRQEIAEGMKLAEHVDVLRETVAKEEVLFQKWQKETLAGIQKEINESVTERDALRREIDRLAIEKKELLKPLNERWEEVNSLKDGLETQHASLLQKESDLQKAISLNIQRERENKSKEERIANLKSRASGELVMAQKDRELAQQELIDERERTSIMNAALALREKELAQKEKITAELIYQTKETLKNIEKYEINLAKREQTLRAGWKNLERTSNKI